MAALDTARDRLAAARVLGLPVPEGLGVATPAETDRVLCGLAQTRLADLDAQIATLVRDRATLAAIVIDPPTGNA